MTISFEKTNALIQDAVNKKYPVIVPANLNAEDISSYACRYYVMRTFNGEAIIRRGWNYYAESDPQYALINYTLADDEKSVSLGEKFTPLVLAFTSSDGKTVIGMDEATVDDVMLLVTEAGKRNSAADSSSINKILQLVMGLVKSEELDTETSSQMSALCSAKSRTPMKKESDAAEAWDGSKSRFSLDQLQRSVPRAIAAWAKKQAGDGTVTKDNLHLPYKEPDGTPNPDGIRNALSRLPQVKGVPSDVLAAAKKELEAALNKANKSKSSKEAVETDGVDEATLASVEVEEGWDGLEGETFAEAFASGFAEATYDSENGVVKNVQMLGPVSKNGRRYSESVMKESTPLFEGIKAYINHQPSKEMGEARKIEDMIGHYKNVSVKNGHMKGDLHLIKDKKVVKEHVIPIIEDKHGPNLVGNSIVARGQMKKADDGIYDVEKIVAARSVDLVSEPATTSGLFAESVGGGVEMDLKDLTIEQLKKDRPDLLESLMKAQDDQKVTEALKADLEAEKKKNQEQAAKIAEYEAKEIKNALDAAIAKEMREAKLPDSFRYEEGTTIKAHLRSLLENCANAEGRKVLIESWESIFALKGTEKPQAKQPVSVEKQALEADGKKPVDDAAISKLSEALIH
jgi:hypothetical protein